MPNLAPGLLCGEAAVAAATLPPKRSTRRLRWPITTAPFRRGRAVREPDRVEVEEVMSLPRQEVDDVVAVAQPVADGVRHRVRLRPHHLVAHQPAIAGQ